MSNYLLVDESNGDIVSWCNLCSISKGYRCIEVDEQPITGDPLPRKRKEMCRGKLTEDFVYTAPEPIPEDAKVSAFRALDASRETGALKTMIEFFQRGMS